MAHPLDAAGPDLLETLVREAMSSPHAAADPNGGLVVARLFQQLARADPSRVAPLLWSGDATFAIETHRLGDVVADVVLEHLEAARAIVEAATRAGDAQHSVELSVEPASGPSEVIFAARPGEALRFLFADDVRADAAELPPVAAPAVPAPGFDDPASDSEPTADAPSATTTPGATPAVMVGAERAADLRGAIEDALAEMSIQVDLAGISELVRDAVTEQLRVERQLLPADAQSIDVEEIVRRVVEHVEARGASVDTALFDRLDDLASRLDPAGMARSVAQQIELMPPAQASQAAPALPEPVVAELADRLAGQMASLAQRLDAVAAHTAAAAEESVRSSLRAGQPSDHMMDSFARRVEDVLAELAHRIDLLAQAERSDATRADVAAAETRRATRELHVVAERLESLVRNLNTTVDLRSLGRLSRSIERAARLLDQSDALPGPAPTDSHRVEATFARRSRGIAVGDHPLHLVPEPEPESAPEA